MKKGQFTKAILLIACVILLLLSYARAFERFELLTFDLRFKLRPQLKCSPDIALIEIDNETLNAFGRWPFDREFHASLIDVLNYAGAKYVVFDILFAEPSASDEQLTAAVQIAGNVYFPVAMRLAEKSDCQAVAQEIDTPLLESLKNSCAGWGHINVITDVDGKRRRVPLAIKYNDQIIPHLALKVAQDYLGLSKQKIDLELGKSVKVGSRSIPLDDRSCFLVNYAGLWTKTFKQYSYFGIINSYSQMQNKQIPDIDLKELKDKVCFIGLTATATSDINPVPLEPVYPMVGLHANIFNSIINNNFLLRLGRLPNLLILIILSLLSALLFLHRKPLVSLLFALGVIIGYILIAISLFIFKGLWIDVFYPVCVVLLIYVVITLFKFLIEQRTRLLIDKELSIAQNIQRSFLPEEFPKKAGLDIAAELKTTKAVGGDLYDFVDISPDMLGIFIGDVSGKGMPAALYMALSIAQFRVSSKGNISTSRTLADLNNRLLTQSRSGLFVTVFYMIYDQKTRKLVYSNGGHLPALLFKARENKIESLSTKEGGLLGLIEGGEFSQNEVNLSIGDIVVLYTDGVIEARNTKAEDFGESRMKEALIKYQGFSAGEITQKIKEEILRFTGKAPQHDDFTVIALKVN